MSVRLTQRDRILGLLKDNKGRRVPSPALGRISLQYGARIKELRELGYKILNEIERVDGQVHGYFILQDEPAPNQQLARSVPDETDRPKGRKNKDTFSPELFPASEPISLMLDHELGRRGAR